MPNDYPQERPYTVKKPPIKGGMLGKALKALTGRKKKLDEVEAKATGSRKK